MLIQGHPSVFLSERARDERQATIGYVSGWSGAEPLKLFPSTPLDCKRIPFLSIKVFLILDRTSYLLYKIMH